MQGDELWSWFWICWDYTSQGLVTSLENITIGWFVVSGKKQTKKLIGDLLILTRSLFLPQVWVADSTETMIYLTITCNERQSPVPPSFCYRKTWRAGQDFILTSWTIVETWTGESFGIWRKKGQFKHAQVFNKLQSPVLPLVTRVNSLRLPMLCDGAVCHVTCARPMVGLGTWSEGDGHLFLLLKSVRIDQRLLLLNHSLPHETRSPPAKIPNNVSFRTTTYTEN